MKKFNKRIFRRNDNQNLLLFNLKDHTENNKNELEITNSPN